MWVGTGRRRIGQWKARQRTASDSSDRPGDSRCKYCARQRVGGTGQAMAAATAAASESDLDGRRTGGRYD